MGEAPRAAAIILAAGSSTRMGSNKLCEKLNGKALVRHVADAALSSSAAPVIIVTGHECERVEAELAGLDIKLVFNPAFASGMASSLKCGIAALPAAAEAAVVLLGDMPLVSSSIIDRLIETFMQYPAMSAVVPMFGDVWGNPVLIGRSLFPEVAVLTGDRGARKLLEVHRDGVIELAVADDAVLTDVDTPEALRQVAAR